MTELRGHNFSVQQPASQRARRGAEQEADGRDPAEPPAGRQLARSPSTAKSIKDASIMHFPARTAPGIAALVLAGGAIVSGCSTQDSADGPAAQHPLPTPTTGTATTLADEMAQRQAIDAYRAMWKDVAAAATTSDWRSPALAHHATGDALSVLSAQLYTDHYNGLISKGAPVNNPVVDSVKAEDPLTAIRIRDCSDATGWLKYRAATGQPADSSPGGKHLINAEVRLSVDSVWRVTRFAVEETGSC